MTSITIKNLSKKYYINPLRKTPIQKSFREDVIQTIFLTMTIPKKIYTRFIYRYIKYMNKFASTFTHKKQKKDVFWALQNISINISQGDIVGIIGSNGSGKSTLLKIIAGITPPTTGEVIIEGKVIALLGIGIGFHTDLTGKENIFLNGTLLGFKKKDIEKEFNNIVSFSGIEKFINTPVKFYSSGMYTRLAFSIATSDCNKGTIFLVDEALSVGDQEFKQKSFHRIKTLAKDKRKIIILVTHDLGFVKDVCTKCIWIDNGKIKEEGSPKRIIAQYIKMQGQ